MDITIFTFICRTIFGCLLGGVCAFMLTGELKSRGFTRQKAEAIAYLVLGIMVVSLAFAWGPAGQ